MDNTTSYSKVIAGTMTWGSWGKDLSQKKLVELIGHCLDVGISTFDHADIYGGYTNEAVFGDAFAKSGISRADVQLITKCGIQIDTEIRKNKVTHYNYSKDYIIWCAEESLKHLKTDYLDLFLLHRPSPLMHPGEIAEAIEQLKKDGKIKAFGVSNFTPSQIAMLETAIPVSGNQVEFSLTADGVMYDGTLDDMIANKRTAMAWSPLGSYFKEKDKKSKRIKKVLKSLKKKYNLNTSQLLLAWILRHPARVHPVVGTATPKRLTDAVKAADMDLELEDWFLLLAASQGHRVP